MLAAAMVATPPLIVTLTLDPATFATVDALRRLHFPPERNHLDAHVTLFHCLPGEHEAEITRRLTAVTRATAPLPMTLTAPRSLGRGVAIEVACDGARQVRAELAAEWHRWLTPQDRQPFRPHVTIQNKVAPEAARALHEQLRLSWSPLTGTATGLTLSRYRGGPWEPAGEFPFTAERA